MTHNVVVPRIPFWGSVFQSPLHIPGTANSITRMFFLNLSSTSFPLSTRPTSPCALTLCLILHCPQLLFPVLMFVMVWRTIAVRVLPDALIDFKPCSPEEGSDSRSFALRLRASWTEGQSIFSWADKGRWQSVDTSDDDTRREANRFRIGFEPVFVDFTKTGTWFVVISLAQVRATMSGLSFTRGCCSIVGMRLWCLLYLNVLVVKLKQSSIWACLAFHRLRCWAARVPTLTVNSPANIGSAYFDSKHCLGQSAQCLLIRGVDVLLLAQWAALACVGVLIDSSVVQLLFFSCIHGVSFVILVVLRPFANK